MLYHNVKNTPQLNLLAMQNVRLLSSIDTSMQIFCIQGKTFLLFLWQRCHTIRENMLSIKSCGISREIKGS